VQWRRAGIVSNTYCSRRGRKGEDAPTTYARAILALRPTQERAVDSARGLSSVRCAGVVQRAVHSGCATAMAKYG
jgi:hypothetical protein